MYMPVKLQHGEMRMYIVVVVGVPPSALSEQTGVPQVGNSVPRALPEIL